MTNLLNGCHNGRSEEKVILIGDSGLTGTPMVSIIWGEPGLTRFISGLSQSSIVVFLSCFAFLFLDLEDNVQIHDGQRVKYQFRFHNIQNTYMKFFEICSSMI